MKTDDLKPGESASDKTEVQQDGTTVQTHEETSAGTPAEHVKEKTVTPPSED